MTRKRQMAAFITFTPDASIKHVTGKSYTMHSVERKRSRPAVSCTVCRRRKIRCNRERPCSNCARSKTVTCFYESAENTKVQKPQNTPPDSTFQHSTVRGCDQTSMPLTPASISSYSSLDLEGMKNRIAELEQKLAQGTASPLGSQSEQTTTDRTLQTNTSLAGSIGVLQSFSGTNAHWISKGIAHKNRVFGQSHWMNGFVMFRDTIEILEPVLRNTPSILTNLQKAKILGRTIKSQRSPSWPADPTTSLPSKEICDRLVEHYLGTMETIYRVLHIPSFMKDYEAIWTIDNESPPREQFIILLKSILAIGAIFVDETFSLRTEATTWVYEVQTWLSCPAFKSRLGLQYIQSSILLLLARQFIDVGSELVWIPVGSLLRTAVYIGLHRDPASLPQLTQFESQMRRRLWNTILELSVQSSLESGGPCGISLTDFDVRPPGNFNDEDFTISDALEKPLGLWTQSTISIALRQTMPARLAVVKFLNDNSSANTYEKTLELDRELRTAYKAMRRVIDSALPIAAPQFAIQAADFIMHKYISSLHVPYFSASLQDPIYAYSRKIEVDSCLKLWTLAFHKTLDTSTENDFNRLCRCGASFFRTFAFHASVFLGVELRYQVQDELDMHSISVRPEIRTVIDDAAAWYLKCIEAGETGIKGILLLRILAAQIDATKRNVSNEELPQLLALEVGKAAEEGLQRLEIVAGEGCSMDVPQDPAAFDFSFGDMACTEDWNLIMYDVFNEPSLYEMFD